MCRGSSAAARSSSTIAAASSTGVQQRRAQPEVDKEPARAERVRAPKALERLGEPPLPHELGAELELVLARHAWSVAALPIGARVSVRTWACSPSMSPHSAWS